MILISATRKCEQNPIDSFKKNPKDTLADSFKSPGIHYRRFQNFSDKYARLCQSSEYFQILVHYRTILHGARSYQDMSVLTEE